MDIASRSRQWENLLMVFAFIVVLCLPLGRQITMRGQTVSKVEMRELAKLTAFSWERDKLADSLKRFPEIFEPYYNDHFGFRTELLQLGSLIKVDWLGGSSSGLFTTGKAGWFFYNGNDSLNDYRGLRKLSSADLAAWKRVMEDRQEWLSKQGIRYLFVIPPNKQTIYPEFMPRKYAKRHGPTMLDQLLVYLANEKCLVPVLDLREPLLKAKSHAQVYYKLDTHWSDQGAFAGCQAIIDRLHEWYPVLVPPQAEGRFDRFDVGSKRDLLGFNDLPRSNRDVVSTYSLPPGETQQISVFKLSKFPQFPANRPVRVKTSQPLSPLRVVILRDSFTSALQKPLSRHFTASTYVWRGGGDAFEVALAKVVKNDRPDLFLEIMIERYLDAVPLDKICFGGVSATD